LIFEADIVGGGELAGYYAALTSAQSSTTYLPLEKQPGVGGTVLSDGSSSPALRSKSVQGSATDSVDLLFDAFGARTVIMPIPICSNRLGWKPGIVTRMNRNGAAASK